ncbi:MAG: Stp1/IreP family PP2C-type Ser/Thr phosphatase [Syntrophomonadaceae bacterium]|nr:Stp1/IreP family PP2C-type Ser/Thr phosphatase [Syntrophomonadaceae bacterium]
MIKHKPGFLVGAVTDIGVKRKNNEDSFIVHQSEPLSAGKTGHHIFIVADGIGGSAAGEVASNIAVKGVVNTYLSLKDLNPPEALRAAILDAHEQINAKALEFPEYSGMGSTLTALVLADNTAHIGQIGDSRAYLIRNNKIVQLTSDQTVTADLLVQGKITPAEAETHPQRHILSQAMGGGRRAPEPELASYKMRAEDIIILCSDGLYNLVNDDEIRKIASKNFPQDACRQLVDLANERGGYDNITVMVIKIQGLPWMRRLHRAMHRLTSRTRVVAGMVGAYLAHIVCRVVNIDTGDI